MKKLKVFAFITEQNGVGYYRLWTPLKMLEAQGKIELATNPYSTNGKYKNIWLPHSQEQLMNDTVKHLKKLIIERFGEKGPDLFIMQRYDNPFYFTLALNLKEVFKVPVIQETDDYVYDVPNTNLGKRSYHEQEERDINDSMGWQRKSLGHFDAYLVSTKFLQEYYGNFSPAYVCPNSLDLSLRKFGPHGKHKEVRLGFSASGAHQEGLWFIEPVIDVLMEKYPSLVFYYYEGLFDLFSKKPYAQRVKKMKWATLEKYPQYLHDLDLDVGIAPLIDRLFNRGKSNLRLLEYWSSGKYPLVASRIGPYKDTITDGKNGFLALERDEWVEKISLLIENPKLREKLGQAGYQTVVRDFNLEKNADIWFRAFTSIIRSYQTGSGTKTGAQGGEFAG